MILIDTLELKRSISASVLSEDGKRIFDIIDEQPTIEERKTGKWIWKTEDKYECSYCHEIITVKEVMNIPQYITCPMCDAKMEGEQP